jgi:hypothetical protein
MKLHKLETVIRYQVSFTPGETTRLLAHPKWQHRIGVTQNRGRSRWAGATLTRSEINDVCDVLGINGREFLGRYERDEEATHGG